MGLHQVGMEQGDQQEEVHMGRGESIRMAQEGKEREWEGRALAQRRGGQGLGGR